jgi:hypothetical protein
MLAVLTFGRQTSATGSAVAFRVADRVLDTELTSIVPHAPVVDLEHITGGLIPMLP